MTDEPSNRSVVLGADAWTVLRTAAAALPLPAGFAGGPLTPDQVAAAERALRASAVVPGDTGDLLADLHPSVRASLLLHLGPLGRVRTAVGLGRDVEVSETAVGPVLSSSLRRRGAGPVTLTTLLTSDVAAHVAGLLPGLVPGPDGREVVVRDAAIAVAAGRAAEQGAEELARLLADGDVPPALVGLEQVARVDVGGRLLLALRTGDGWRTARLAGEDLVLTPLDADRLVTDVAAALAPLVAGAAA
ncbi:MAG: hypothetical protein JWM64_1740 [Frankiales bacterium]|nr:hypothetical protein [Frankiales bacterium]